MVRKTPSVIEGATRPPATEAPAVIPSRGPRAQLPRLKGSLLHVVERPAEKVAGVALNAVLRHVVRPLSLPHGAGPPKAAPPQRAPAKPARRGARRVTRARLGGRAVPPLRPRPLAIALITATRPGVLPDRPALGASGEAGPRPLPRGPIGRTVLGMASRPLPNARPASPRA